MLAPRCLVCCCLARSAVAVQLATVYAPMVPYRVNPSAKVVHFVQAGEHSTAAEGVDWKCRPVSELQSEYGAVPYSDLQHDDEALWSSCEAAGEADDLPGLHVKCTELLECILAREENEVVVVSHSALLHHLFSFGYPPEQSPPVQSRLIPELRSEPAATPQPDAEHAERVAAMPPLLSFHSAPLQRLLRSPYDFCETKTAVLMPLVRH